MYLFFSSLHFNEYLFHFHLIVRVTIDRNNSARCFGLNIVLHLHALNRYKCVTLLYHLALLAEDFDYSAGHGGSYLSSGCIIRDRGLNLFALLDKLNLLCLEVGRVSFVVELSDVVILVYIVINIL